MTGYQQHIRDTEEPSKGGCFILVWLFMAALIATAAYLVWVAFEP